MTTKTGPSRLAFEERRLPETEPRRATRPDAAASRPHHARSARQHEAQRDQRERDRQHELRDPRRDVGADRRCRPRARSCTICQPPQARTVDAHAPNAAARMSAARRQPPGGNERAGGEREQLAVARGDRRAEEADPQREMLNDRTGAGNAEAERLRQKISSSGRTTIASSASDANDPRWRSDTVPRQRRVVVNRELWLPRRRSLRGGCVLRYSSRSLTARSKMSGGTISPRIVFGEVRRAGCCHSGPVALVTVKPVLGHHRDGDRVLLRHLDLQPLLDAVRRGLQLRPVGRGNRVPGLRRDDGRADDRREADVEHVRRLPVPLEQQRRERRRRQPSIMPVVRPVRMSVIAIARGSKPLALNHCTICRCRPTCRA